jgi:hypothetical protein
MEYIWDNEASRWVVSSSLDEDHAEHYENALWAENVVARPLTQWMEYTRPWTEDDQIDTFLWIQRL